MAIRPVVATEAPALAVLAERTFRESFESRNSPENMDLHCSRNFGPEIQAREMADRGLVTRVAEEAGRLVGYTQLRLGKASDCVKAAQPAELSRIYVVREWQGQGVAQDLMKSALATAAGAGCDRLWLGVWEHNPKAIAFYRKFGFEIVGQHTFMLGNESQRDIVMAASVR
jgi:ribosomal protein S18 acetylase RimI-like enzyme